MPELEEDSLPLPSRAVVRREARLRRAALLGELSRAHARVLEAEEALADLVASSRAEGLSWQDIGAGVGIDRETARRRYGNG